MVESAPGWPGDADIGRLSRYVRVRVYHADRPGAARAAIEQALAGGQGLLVYLVPPYHGQTGVPADSEPSRLDYRQQAYLFDQDRERLTAIAGDLRASYDLDGRGGRYQRIELSGWRLEQVLRRVEEAQALRRRLSAERARLYRQLASVERRLTRAWEGGAREGPAGKCGLGATDRPGSARMRRAE